MSSFIEETIETTETTETTTESTTETVEDLSTIFTPEEVTAKKESIAAAKAEEERRAALTEEERAAEDKAAEEKAKGDAVPEEYAEFKLPDGVQPNKEILDMFIPLLKEAKLTQNQAQSFVDLHAKIEATRMTQWDADKSARLDAIKQDKEIGGDNFEQSKQIANRFINTFLSAEEKQSLHGELTRFGDLPMLVKLLTRAGKATSEGRLVTTTATGAAKKSDAQVFYGGDK